MDECDDFLIMSMYKLIANSAENLLLLHPLLRRGGWLVTLLCRVVTWCEELPGGFHDRDHSTCEKPGKSLCFKVLKSKFCFTYRIQFRLVIHLELIGFRLITGLANLHVGVSSEAPCVIHQAMSSLPLSSLNLQLWKPNNLESPTFSSIGSNLLKVCYSILWLYSRCNCGIMNLETHCSIQTNPFCMSLFKLIFHTSYPLIKINFTLIMITTRVSLMMMTMDFIWYTEAPSLTVATRDRTTSVFTTCLTLAMDHWGMAPSLSLKLTSLL